MIILIICICKVGVKLVCFEGTKPPGCLIPSLHCCYRHVIRSDMTAHGKIQTTPDFLRLRNCQNLQGIRACIPWFSVESRNNKEKEWISEDGDFVKGLYLNFWDKRPYFHIFGLIWNQISWQPNVLIVYAFWAHVNESHLLHGYIMPSCLLFIWALRLPFEPKFESHW